MKVSLTFAEGKPVSEGAGAASQTPNSYRYKHPMGERAALGERASVKTLGEREGSLKVTRTGVV